MRRIAVVGATGNVGTAVLRRLHAEPDVQVVGVARRIPKRGTAPYDDVEWHGIDVAAPGAVEALTPVFDSADAVVHLAWALQPTHDIPVQYAVNVEGTAAVLAAVAAARVPQVVVASSVGAYRATDKRLRVDESWPVDGIETATYSIHKAINEAVLDDFADAHPDVVVSRLRPGLVFQHDVAAELRGLFLGKLVPMRIVDAVRWAVLPLPGPFVFQAVHADDLADAYWRVVDRRAPGAFNIAASPVLTPPRIAAVLGMRGAVRIPLRLLRSIVTLTWRLRLQPTDAGWIDIAAGVPIMRTDRAREVLGWEARHTSVEALSALVDGFRTGANVPASAPLRG